MPEHRKIPILEFAAFALILFGIKLWLIGNFGNATPYWDQWDAEALNLYKPFLDCTLGWRDLVAAHNEHRILTTRLLDLALLSLNEIWNPILQMAVNALLHVCMIVVSIGLLARVVGQAYLPALLAFSLFLFGLPFGWENTLGAFQSQFYFVQLFSIASIWFTVTNSPLSAAWWIGILCAIPAYFSMASGIVAPLASAVVTLSFYAMGLNRNRRQLIAIAILFGLSVIEWTLTPNIARHAPLKASSIAQFFEVFLAVNGWPIPILYLGALIANLPSLLFVVMLLRERPPTSDRRWFLLGLVACVFLQNASIAYGRSTGYFYSRYLDLYSTAILVNFTCMICLTARQLGKFDKRKREGAAIWLLIVLASLGWNTSNSAVPEAREKRDISVVEENNTKKYLVTGDLRYLNDKARNQIPMSNAKTYANILAMPHVAAILPANLQLPLVAKSIVSEPPGAFAEGGVSPEMPIDGEATFGNYRARDGAAIGKIELQFDSLHKGRLEIPVAGYPGADGNKVEIVQNGRRYALNLSGDPGTSWAIGYANVEKGAFAINLSNLNQSAWLAVKLPRVVGRFDASVSQLLGNSILFIAVGLGLALLLATRAARERHNAISLVQGDRAKRR